MANVEFIYEGGYYAVCGQTRAMDYMGGDFEVSDELAKSLSDALDALSEIERRIEQDGRPLSAAATKRQERARRA